MNYNRINLRSRWMLGAAVFAALTSAAYGSVGTYVGTDTLTQGNWNFAYGADGYLIANGPASGPTFAAASVTGSIPFTWAGLTTDPRALVNPASPIMPPNRIASAYSQYQSKSFSININTLNGIPQLVSLYMLDWDSNNRVQTVTLRDASTNAFLDQHTFSNFHGGVYGIFVVAGNVVMTVTPSDSTIPAVSGVFFGFGGAAPQIPSPYNTSAAIFRGTDSFTQGTWPGVYGLAGYMIANGATQLPAYATTSVTGTIPYTWAALTSDPRALENPSGVNNRIASAYSQYQSKSFAINVNMHDNNFHRVALYLLDWDSNTRLQTVTIRDLSTNTLLEMRTFAGFHNGMWAMFDIKGAVVITVTPDDSTIPAVSGVFFN